MGPSERERYAREAATTLVVEISALSRSLKEAAEQQRTGELDDILQRRQLLLHELHRMVANGLPLNEGLLGQRWRELMEQDKATEAALVVAMSKLRTSLATVRQKVNTNVAYGARTAPVPAHYLDIKG
ncbi:MAG: hypothetical protein FJX76_22000 [Armatimonadetes bacterium]|nr:hypothetical protein [Armatimonadota bacterium]